MALTNESHSRASVKGLERGLQVLDYLFSVAEEPLNQIAVKMEMPPSTLHRLLGVLEAHGYVSSYQGVYRLGVKGFWFTSSSEPIRKLLEELSRETGETTNFAMLVHQEMEFLERAVSDHALSFVVSVGSRVPLHCSAMGKAVLAFHPELLDGLCLTSKTVKTITDMVVLRAELAVARHRGFALDQEEFFDGVFCIAVPVFGRGHIAVGAVSISGPAVRFSRDKAFRVAERLKGVGDRMTRLLQ